MAKNGDFKFFVSFSLLLMLYTLCDIKTRLDVSTVSYEEIDFVISWVNGSDPAQVSMRAERGLLTGLTGDPDKQLSPQGFPTTGLETSRWRDWDELRYCLRSIERYAPWYRRIYLVVNNHDKDMLPGWLDLEAARTSGLLQIVNVKDLFADPQHDLPTANSNAVEVNLHRIKGLSERFIYFNNDWFINKRVEKNEFFYPPGQGQWVYTSIVPQANHTTSEVPRDRAMVYNKLLLDKIFGEKTRLQNVNAPMAIDKSILAEMAEGPFKREFQETSSHKFRNETDVVLPFLYGQYVFETRRGYPSRPGLYSLSNAIQFGLRDSEWHNRGMMALVYAVNPRYICLNDDVTNPTLAETIKPEVTMFLEIMYPVPSPFEKIHSVKK